MTGTIILNAVGLVLVTTAAIVLALVGVPKGQSGRETR
jgi:hypothetical protein